MQNFINETLKSIYQRSSVRAFKEDQIIPNSDLIEMAKAAMASPSAKDSRPWHFIIVTNQNAKLALASELPHCKMLAGASAGFVICGDQNKFLEEPFTDYWVQDLSSATQNLLLAAHSMGYGAVWTGVYPQKARQESVCKILGLPKRMIPFCVIPVGVPRLEPKIKDKFDSNNISILS